MVTKKCTNYHWERIMTAQQPNREYKVKCDKERSASPKFYHRCFYYRLFDINKVDAEKKAKLDDILEQRLW